MTVRPTGGRRDARSCPTTRSILSPGAAPVRPPLPGFDRVRVLRTVEDAELLAGRGRRSARARPSSSGPGSSGSRRPRTWPAAASRTTVVEAARPGADAARPRDGRARRRGTGRARAWRSRPGVAVAEVTDERRGAGRRAGRSPASSWWPPSACGPTCSLARDGRARARAPRRHRGRRRRPHQRSPTSTPSATRSRSRTRSAAGRRSSPWPTSPTARAAGWPTRSAGWPVRPAPSQGTAIVKVFGVTAAMTGWNERRLRAAGRPYRVIHSHPMSHAALLPRSRADVAQAALRPRRRSHPGRAGGRRSGGRQADRRAGDGHGGGAVRPTPWPTWSSPTRRRSPRPRTRSTCSATWRRT